MERIVEEMFDALEAGKTNSITFCVNELPIPCTKGFENWTVKDYFQKINEELDEVKDAILSIVELEWKPEGGTFAENDVNVIAEEAADTITAITSMLEAMGIEEKARQAAQRRVNNNNRQRGRF